MKNTNRLSAINSLNTSTQAAKAVSNDMYLIQFNFLSQQRSV